LETIITFGEKEKEEEKYTKGGPNRMQKTKKRNKCLTNKHSTCRKNNLKKKENGQRMGKSNSKTQEDKPR